MALRCEFNLASAVKSSRFEVPFSACLSQAKQLSLFIDMSPGVLGGSPRIAGTRIPVYMILNAIEEHGTIEGALCSYRSLSVEQVKDAVLFAANVLECPVVEYSQNPR
jgi:uncharacterized protein (DUF433 family)